MQQDWLEWSLTSVYSSQAYPVRRTQMNSQSLDSKWSEFWKACVCFGRHLKMRQSCVQQCFSFLKWKGSIVCWRCVCARVCGVSGGEWMCLRGFNKVSQSNVRCCLLTALPLAQWQAGKSTFLDSRGRILSVARSGWSKKQNAEAYTCIERRFTIAVLI